MKINTVKRRIFILNTCMVLTTLILFLGISLCMMKIYSETIETELKISAQQLLNAETVNTLWNIWSAHKNSFFAVFVLDGVLCIVVLLFISQVFTQKLTACIMEPLDALAEGAARVKQNDLTQEVSYTGDLEFENVCATFNDMQRHILEEQEKNRSYEKKRRDMVAGISHDLRTPLTAIRGTIKALLDRVVTGEQQQEKFLYTAYRRTEQMDQLLGQLLSISGMEAGNMVGTYRVIDIQAFLQQYVHERQTQEQDSMGQLRLAAAQTGTEPCLVSIDTEQFQRILDNLIGNSRKYSQAEPLEIEIGVVMQQAVCTIRVRDNGIGVPKEKLPYIFDEFYRTDESRTGQKGNGLGLYIVKCLTESMGGRVYAQNDRGLAVYIELPVADRKEVQNGETQNIDRRG